MGSHLDVRSLVIDPANPSTLYLTGVTGLSTFKTIDGGANWTPLNTAAAGLLAGGFALAIDPAQPSTIYAGGPFSSVVKSTDGGASWFFSSNGLTDFFVNVLAIDPSNTTTLYAGTTGVGVFRSTDGGANWAPRNSGHQSVFALAIDPRDTATLYAGTPGGVFKSTNGGGSWYLARSGNVRTIAFGPPSHPPVADAGPDQFVTVAPGDTPMVTLDGSGSSSPDGDPLTFTWTNSFGTVMGVTPTVPLAAGVHVITLTVDDGKGGTDADTVEITVNQAPVAEAGPNQVIQVPLGSTAAVTLDGSGSSDPDGDPLTFTWTNSFGTVMGVMPTVTLAPGVHTITVTIDDGNGGTDSDTVEITVNQPPTADAGADQLVTVAPGDTAMVALNGSGSSDPDGDPLTYTWTNSFGTAMGVMPTVPLAAGVHIVTLTVDDGKGGIDSDTVEITVNQAPVADAGSGQTVNANLGSAIVTLDGSGSSDPDGDPLTFTWTGPFGTVGGVSPTVTLPGGVHTITLTVEDGRGGVDTDTVTVAVRALKLSSGSLSFLFGKSHGASQPLSIRSVGGRVSYSIPRIASWLTTQPDRGESNGETDTIQVIVDPARKPGTYSVDMIIRGNGNIMARIPMTMVVPEGGVPAYPQLRLPDDPAVDAADFIPHGEPGHAMAGKSIIAIFGEGFVAEGEFRAETVPLPTKLGGVRVLFDGTVAPLYLVTPGLIHAQLPMGLRGPTATLLVVRDFQKAGSNPQEIEINDYSPGIFTLSQNGEGQGIVTFANSPDLAAPVGTVGNSRPATGGDLLTIYANGMGPVEPPLMDGHNSCEPDGVCLPDGSNVVLRHTTMTSVIRVGGVVVPAAKVVFSGSSPASVGVNEIVFEMPGGVPPGDAVPITIEIGGVVSKGGVTIAVE